jgi:hypothetical protein
LHRYSVIACARWETPYIAEWLAYYEAIGFDHVYLYCNDDDPAEFAAEVASATRARPAFVSFTHFPGQGRQRDMYVDAMRRACEETEWVTFLDIDEFLVLRGCDDVRAFMQPFEASVDSVHFNWVYFGNNGFIKRPSGAVLPQYTVRQSILNANTKHLTRAAMLSADLLTTSPFPFWHGLADPHWAGLRRVNVLGADMGPLLKGFPKVADAYVANASVRDAMLSKAIVNHYAFKSEADFLIRANRGSGGDFGAQARWRSAYESGNFRGILDGLNEVEDTYLSQFSASRFPGSAPATPVRVPIPPLKRISVLHRLWTSDLVLGFNGRVRHVQHGSLGKYKMTDGVLQVKWDDWQSEDVFIERGDVFMSAEAGTMSQAG